MAEVDMIIAILIFFVVICLLLTIFALFYISGVFHNVEIGTGKPPIGQVIIAYKFAKGPYKDSGYLFTELGSRLKSDQKCLGIYYDDPKVVPTDKCRYIIGGVIAENDETPDEEQKKMLMDNGYRIFQLPSVSYAVRTDFPYHSQLSITIAILRVYPKLSAYVKEKKLCAHPFLEIYNGSTMHFMAPLAKQNEFYVEEAKDIIEEMHDADDLDSSVDGSSYGGSVSRSEFSVATSYMGSIIEDSDDEDDDLLRLDEVKEEPSDTPIREINVNDTAVGEVTLCDIKNPRLPELSIPDELPVNIASFQDSGFSSEQVITPEISPLKTEENKENLKKEENQDTNDGNDSSSSFEVIDDKPEL